MSDPCAVCHRPIPEGECHRMVALGMVVHASLLQCGGDHLPEPPERAILLDLIAGVQTAIDDYEPRMHGSARAYLIGIRDRAEARLREVSGE